MRRKALLTVLCCLAVNSAAENQKPVNSSVPLPTDNASAPSAPTFQLQPLHIFHHPFRIYASGAPYSNLFNVNTPYSLPTKPGYTIPGLQEPQKAASHLVPVKEEAFVLHSQNGFLKDSYGNKFVGNPQTVAYKTTFPQQYVRLQDLPLHLSQPLVAAPGYAFNAPQFTTPTRQNPGIPNNYRFNHAAPFQSHPGHKHATSFPASHPTSPQQQSSNSRTVYTNRSPGYHGQPFQRLQQKPQVNYGPATLQQPQSAKQVTVTTANNNGKAAAVTLATKPPLPLLDVNLLKPLTFSNPIVPQVQHFLPPITYRLPEAQIVKHNNEFVVQKTKSYDTGFINDSRENDSDSDKTISSTKPAQNTNSYKTSHNLKPSDTPKHSHENKNNSPKFRETYNKHVIKYDKKTQHEPENYSYNKQVEDKPVHYSFSTTSKEPIKTVHYENHNQNQSPKQPIRPEHTRQDERENNNSQNSSEEASSENDSRESDESQEEGPVYHNRGSEEERPKQNYQNRPDHKQRQYHDANLRHGGYHTQSSNPTFRPSPADNTRHHKPNQLVQDRPAAIIYGTLSKSPQPTQGPKPPVQNFHVQSINPEYYEENVRLVPKQQNNPHKQIYHSQHPDRPIHIQNHNQNIYQHHNEQNSHHGNNNNRHPVSHPHPPPPNHQDHRNVPSRPAAQSNFEPSPHPPSQTYEPTPHVVEKSRKIIIQEETPDEMHSHREQMIAEMVSQGENNEEDFDEAYKNAAFGFPGYDRDPEEIEKDIYNPASYGVNVNHDEYNIDSSPFEQYQKENDDYPTEARSGYKNAVDDMKEDYYLDYSVARPESLLDMHKSKVNYYKMFKQDRPTYYEEEPEKKQRFEKFVVDPGLFGYQPSKKAKGYLAALQEAPEYEYDYAKEAPKEGYAFHSGPIRRKTQFVEPQFQYGFEPISLPSILDSELSAMASNHSPDSETPGVRKKIYQENWYIKKTSTNEPAN
ncbi:hypothetical protein JYU34_003888 [Plutella xylostella]|uniref:Uncharacterized protein n=1 Tax=Plutella xylostella TaxID=51655 RepID=A0ABQ7R142_PLUXY|nr:hypothetical protein JYU34_003888 [Plutella xylostella]